MRANTNAVPNRWEWGTLNHECIAGITACVDYLADLGRQVDPSASTRRAALLAAYGAIQQHEHGLAEILIRRIAGDSRTEVLRHSRSGQAGSPLSHRCGPHRRPHSARAGHKLGERGFFTWDGNYYALNLTERLDVEKDGGFLRIGLAHYNTAEKSKLRRFLIRQLREISVPASFSLRCSSDT